METKPLKQCKTCPWKAGASVDNIPRYNREKHRALKSAIAEPGSTAGLCSREQAMMACHYSQEGEERVCVGWLAHQIGPGNNIALRFRVLVDPSLQQFKTDGPQRARFEQTFARGRKTARVK